MKGILDLNINYPLFGSKLNPGFQVDQWMKGIPIWKSTIPNLDPSHSMGSRLTRWWKVSPFEHQLFPISFQATAWVPGWPGDERYPRFEYQLSPIWIQATVWVPGWPGDERYPLLNINYPQFWSKPQHGFQVDQVMKVIPMWISTIPYLDPSYSMGSRLTSWWMASPFWTSTIPYLDPSYSLGSRLTIDWFPYWTWKL